MLVSVVEIRYNKQKPEEQNHERNGNDTQLQSELIKCDELINIIKEILK